MRFAGAQTIYPCSEHDSVAVPIRTLLGANGELEIYPEVSGKGYFDIDYRQGKLILRATRFVGLIPISDRVAIHVTPKAPIANLFYMMWRAGMRLQHLEGFLRGYQRQPDSLTSPEEMYVDSFLTALRGTRRAGVLKSYRRRETESLKGRLLMGRTVSRFYSRGYTHRHLFEVFEYTTDTVENQILKHVSKRLSRHFSENAEGDANVGIAKQLAGFLTLLTGADDQAVNEKLVARTVPPLIRGLPRSHQFYEPALWLALLIATRSGVRMEAVGPSRFETVVIDVSEVFERYVRKICEEKLGSVCEIVDGNTHTVPLFASGERHNTRPDYYFKRGTLVTAVADAKYKPGPSREDRYELLAFCEALNVNTSAFICPQLDGHDRAVHHGTTASGRRISIVRINLASRDLRGEESDFCRALASTLNLL